MRYEHTVPNVHLQMHIKSCVFAAVTAAAAIYASVQQLVVLYTSDSNVQAPLQAQGGLFTNVNSSIQLVINIASSSA
jgi:hypothetical protein